jgi:hypothetical protein
MGPKSDTSGAEEVFILILETALHEFMLDMRQALAIWLALIVVALVGFGSVMAVTKESLPRGMWGRRTQRRLNQAAQAQELSRYADEVAVAASRAAAMARRRYGEWVAVQRTQEAAWRAFESVDEFVRRLHRAAMFPDLNPLTAEELADRQRYLARAATDAYARGELSAEQLGDALFHRNGWDPCKHPLDQQMILRTIARERLLRAYQEVSAIERGAWRAADMAASARRSLEDEAFAAATRVLLAQSRATATVTPRWRLFGTVVARPSVAVS